MSKSIDKSDKSFPNYKGKWVGNMRRDELRTTVVELMRSNNMLRLSLKIYGPQAIEKSDRTDRLIASLKPN